MKAIIKSRFKKGEYVEVQAGTLKGCYCTVKKVELYNLFGHGTYAFNYLVENDEGERAWVFEQGLRKPD